MPGEFPSESVLQRAIRLLATEGRSARVRPSRRLLNRLGSNARRISLAHRTLSGLLAKGNPVPAEAEWLLETLEALYDYCFVQPVRLAQRRELLNAKLGALGKPPLK